MVREVTKNQIKYIEGDLFEAVSQYEGLETIIIPHVCNSKKGWGAGFVLPLAKTFPQSRDCFFQWHQTHENTDVASHTGPYQLGHVQFVRCCRFVSVKPKIVVANMVAQTLGGNRPISYKYLGRCMERVSAFVGSENVRIVAPMFGSGLAMGNWSFIEQLIEDHWGNMMEINIHYLPQSLPNGWTLPNLGIHDFEKRP